MLEDFVIPISLLNIVLLPSYWPISTQTHILPKTTFHSLPVDWGTLWFNATHHRWKKLNLFLGSKKQDKILSAKEINFCDKKNYWKREYFGIEQILSSKLNKLGNNFDINNLLYWDIKKLPSARFLFETPLFFLH